MNIPRRSVVFAGAAIAMAAATFISVPAHASDASEASDLADKAVITLRSFASDKDFATVGPALARGEGRADLSPGAQGGIHPRRLGRVWRSDGAR